MNFPPNYISNHQQNHSIPYCCTNLPQYLPTYKTCTSELLAITLVQSVVRKTILGWRKLAEETASRSSPLRVCSDPLLKSGLSGCSLQPPQSLMHKAAAFITAGVIDNGPFMTVSESCPVPTDHAVFHFHTHIDTHRRDVMCIMELSIHPLAFTWSSLKTSFPYAQEDDNLQPPMQLLIWGYKSKLAKPLPLSHTKAA